MEKNASIHKSKFFCIFFVKIVNSWKTSNDAHNRNTRRVTEGKNIFMVGMMKV